MSYDFDFYSGNHLNYPIKPAKPTISRNPSAVEAKAWADALEDYERDMERFKEDLNWYRSEKASLLIKFQDMVRADYGLEQEPFNLIWSKAWERGHSGGLHEVFSEFDELFEFLIKWSKVAK